MTAAGSALQTTFDTISENKKAAAELERAHAITMLRDNAYEDAGKDADMYQRYIDEITARLADLRN